MGMTSFIKSVAVAAAIASSAITSAQAATFNFTFSGNAISASGVFTTDPGPDWLITGIAGTFNGESMNLVAPGGFQGNDNILLGGSPQLSILGFAFSTASLGTWNVYYDAVATFCPASGYCAFNGATDTPITFAAVESPVPLPAALPLFAAALIGGGGALAWRKKRKQKMETLAA